jgi:superkiller protein 3
MTLTLFLPFDTLVLAQSKIDKQAIKYYNEGTNYSEQGKIEDAITAFNKALEIDPNYADAHYNLGKTYHYKAALTNDTNPDQMASKGSPKHKYKPKWDKGLVELDLALKEFQELVRLQPKAADAYGMLGLIYHNKGEYDEAIKFSNRAIELDPTGLDGQDSRHDIALIYFYVQGKKKEAIQLLNENLKVNPNHALSRQLLKIIGE